MEETKIWAVEGTSATPLNTTNQMETEGLLEDILTANPDMLEEGLQLVGRQTPTASGPLDLLGVDGDGRLVVFELKRDTLRRDAVAQIIDYASALDAMDSETLSDFTSKNSGNYEGIQKIENFGNWYSELRASNDLTDEGIESLTQPRMVLVGLGVDDTTQRMVQYMASSGMDISLLTFHGFINSGGEALLARNVEVDSADVTPKPPSRTRNRKARFQMRVQSLSQDMQIVLTEIERMFREQNSRLTGGFSNTRMSFGLDFSWSSEHAWDDGRRAKRRETLFIEIDENRSVMIVGFHPIAVEFAPDDFNKLNDSNIDFTVGSTGALFGEHGYMFPLRSRQDWKAKKEKIEELTKKVCEAYDAARQKALFSQ